MLSSVAVGDWDSDNRSDIVFTNMYNNYIGILIGNGDGTFTTPIIYSTGMNSEPQLVVVHDFNRDGHLDLAVANSGTSSIGVFLGIGNGTFQEQRIFSVGNNPSAIAIGDFNHDNQSDLAVVNRGSGNIVVLLGYGNGSFQMSWIISTDECVDLVADDFNNDGELDLAVSYYINHNYLKVFFGNGKGTFSRQITLSTGQYSQPYSIAVSDFNHDSQLDLAVVNRRTNNIGIMLGNVNGTFQTQTTYSTGGTSDPSAIVIGDFNNDNHLDFAVPNWSINNVGIFLGLGDGTFLEQMTFSFGTDYHPKSIKAGDFNNDGKLDIVTTNEFPLGLHIILNSCDCCVSTTVRQHIDTR